MHRLLVIAGSDSSAGAGIQADLKTAQAFGVYAQTAITAVTVQDTNGVHGIETISAPAVKRQIEVALGDIGADAIKIGMLGSGLLAAAVADALENVSLPLVLDPVLVSSSGRQLLDNHGIGTLKSRLLSRAFLVTPNWPECEVLTGIRPDSDTAMEKAAKAFTQLGARNVLIKGGHGDGASVRDVLIEPDGRISVFESPRQDTRHTHGTGCVLSTAIACGLAQGKTLTDAVRLAHDFVQNAIRTAPGLGSGHGPLNLK
ncbi:MAG TPA: bifunctional hydroxymethylpyrimidine kinase/phosphomethylpyrimidine kinase [Rhizomicrobium sp.]|jgi:hydroxymethylpyrimidine/phosphomethylpyrimidine kinase|nr:bifunctional hydroxymethylpyrimidine kinase/phosphomethylpyrimidine kinase [Rhizomicrobium sp.]